MVNNNIATFVSYGSTPPPFYKININISGSSPTLSSLEKVTGIPVSSAAVPGYTSFNGTKPLGQLNGSVVIAYQGQRLSILNSTTTLVNYTSRFITESYVSLVNGVSSNEVWMGQPYNLAPFMRLQSIT